MPALFAALLLAQTHVHPAGAGMDPTHGPQKLDANPPAARGTMTPLALKGGASRAYLARPRGKPKGALLVLHEWWGLNGWVKHQADLLADEGYLALAVDLYQGKVATTSEEASKLLQQKDEAFGDQVEEAGLEWLKKNAGGAKVGTIGWCAGGGESLKASLHDPGDVAVTVMYYGEPIADVARLKTLRGPLLGIWAKKDQHITPDKVAAFDQALTEAGVPHEFHAYDADHAFANPSGGRYNGEAAKDAWEKTRAFLGKNLR